jgi:hypothetical protein
MRASVILTGEKDLPAKPLLDNEQPAREPALRAEMLPVGQHDE